MQPQDSDASLSKPPQLAEAPGDEKDGDRYRIISAAMLILVALVATFLFSPSIHKLDLPVSDSEIGKVATANIRADRDYMIVDEEATEKARDDAVQQVRAVYFHDMDLSDLITSRIRDAFGLMRGLLARPVRASPPDAGLGQQKGAAPRSPDAAPKARKPVKKGAAPKPARESDTTVQKLLSHKDEFIKTLQIVMDDGEFEVLARYGFSKDAEDGLLSLVQPVMQEMIVANKELLAAEKGQGISVQRIYAQEQRAEGMITSVGVIKDTDDEQKQIDRKSDFVLADLPRDERPVITALAKKLITANLRFDKAETERRKDEVRSRVLPVTISIKKGQMIVRDGDKIERRHLMIFRGMREVVSDHRDLLISIGIFVFSILIIFVPYTFAKSFVRKFAPKPRDLVFMQLLLVCLLFLGKLFVVLGAAVAEQSRHIPLRTFQFVIPFSAGAMMCRFVLNSESALVFTAVMSMFAGLCLDGNLLYAGYTLIGSMVAAYGVAQATARTTVLKAGLLAGLANVAAALAICLFHADTQWTEVGLAVVFAMGNGLLAAMIVTAFTPAVEGMFGYITDVKLLELANLNHPLLKELIVQAPGTYHHSIVVGSLVEAAAEAIHANPLLARVTAYYHDIGKIRSPQYFAENQKDGINRHDKIKPSMSALVLKAHVKDGIEIAKNHKLGQPIIDTIAQHHGTSIIKYFYMKARGSAGPDDVVNEQDYRYPGPKPRTREAALVMLADAVDAAAKSVPDLDPIRLRGLVQKIINNFFKDEQLSECDITLKDLHLIAAAFIRVLEGIYHQRPEYQEPAVKVADEKPKAQGEDSHPPAGKALSDHPDLDSQDDEPEDLQRLGL